MDKYYQNIRVLIENNLVEIKKREISKNSHTLLTYHNIGKILVEAQDGKNRAKYGENLIKKYSIKLTEEFGKGYDISNLKRMRKLYLMFPKGGPVAHQLTWSHYYILLAIKNESKRNYYINSTIENSFSKRQLIDYIRTNSYERLVNKENIKLKYIDNNGNDNSSTSILEMIKNPIIINIGKREDKITEKALKSYMIETIEKTMRELGIGFAYMGSEIPICLNGKTHRPDLVFFNVKLNAYVIFEIKINELKKSDISQIEFYINYYDSEIKEYFHNPTIGITISKKVDTNITKYLNKDNIKHTTYELE